MHKILRGLTNERLQALYDRVLARIWKACEGGTTFGIDLPTLRIIHPGYCRAYLAIRQEGQRRVREGLATVV